MRKTKETQAQRIATLEKIVSTLWSRQKEILKYLDNSESIND